MKIASRIPKDFKLEQVALFGLAPDVVSTNPGHATLSGVSRFAGLKEYCLEHFEYTPDADVYVVAEKYTGQPVPEASKFKRVYLFNVDDSDEAFDIPENAILFRSSFYASTRKPNEFAHPIFVPDDYTGVAAKELAIGFCGGLTHRVRAESLSKLYHCGLKTDFVVRRGYWAPGIPPEQARREYIENIDRNIFNVCCRGAGNFSYRFYEVMMMGRIPIFVDTDCVIPHSAGVKAVFLKPDFTPEDARAAVDAFCREHPDLEIPQRNNREHWEKHYSCRGFLDDLRSENFKT